MTLIAVDDEITDIAMQGVTDGNVLTNDTTGTYGTATVTSYTQGQFGTVAVNTEGRVVYQQTQPFTTDTDSFTYTLTNSTTGETATATVKVYPAGTSMQYIDAIDDTETLLDDLPITIDVLLNDIQPLPTDRIELAELPTNGTAVVQGLAILYTPTAGSYADDTFTYTVFDEDGHSDTATVTINLATSTTDPVASDDDGFWTFNTVQLVVSAAEGLLLNDWSYSGMAIAELYSQAMHGTAVIHDDGSFEYTPDPNEDYYGEDTFGYRLKDGNAVSQIAYVKVDNAKVEIEHEVQNQSAFQRNWENTPSVDAGVNVRLGYRILGVAFPDATQTWTLPASAYKFYGLDGWFQPSWTEEQLNNTPNNDYSGAPSSMAPPLTHSEAELKLSTVNLFWGSPGEKVIQLSVVYDGKTLTMSRTITVNDLPYVSVATDSSSVMLHQQFVQSADAAPGSWQTHWNGRAAFQYGEHGMGQSGESGITATGTVEDTRGEYIWVPLVNFNVTVDSTDPAKPTSEFTGVGLDKFIKDGLTYRDSPGSSVSSLAYRIQLEFDFQWVLMWRSDPDSYFVPVLEFDWGWSGEAIKSSEGVWSWLGQPLPYIGCVLATSDFPTWESIVSAYNPPQ